jgi:hypothetical protein
LESAGVSEKALPASVERIRKIVAMHVCFFNSLSQTGYETRLIEGTELLQAETFAQPDKNCHFYCT